MKLSSIQTARWTPTMDLRHTETGYGAIIKIEPNDLSDAGGIKLKGYMPTEQADRAAASGQLHRPERQAVAKIAQTKLPDAICLAVYPGHPYSNC